MYRDLVYSVSIQATLMEEEKLYYVQSSVSFSAVWSNTKRTIPSMCRMSSYIRPASTNWGIVM